MSESPFRSGPWTGFFNYTGPEDRHRMDLRLNFENGSITGDGTDCIGPFLISGSYLEASHDCSWRKSYIGAHSVYYSGCGDSNGIWGQWVIQPLFKGGFHIWPLTDGVETRESQSTEAGVDVSAASPVTEEAGSARKL